MRYVFAPQWAQGGRKMLSKVVRVVTRSGMAPTREKLYAAIGLSALDEGRSAGDIVHLT